MAEVEFYDVSKDGVEVRVKAEQNYLDRETSEGSEDVQNLHCRYLSEVGMVNVCHYVEEQFLDSSQNLVEICRKLMSVLCGEEQLVVDSFLGG